jgi:hypothetical protein
MSVELLEMQHAVHDVRPMGQAAIHAVLAAEVREIDANGIRDLDYAEIVVDNHLAQPQIHNGGVNGYELHYRKPTLYGDQSSALHCESEKKKARNW